MRVKAKQMPKLKSQRIPLKREESATLRIIAAEQRAIRLVHAAKLEADRRVAIAVARAEQDALRKVLDRKEELEYFWRSANHEFGRKAGEHLRDWMEREFDPMAAEKKRIFDAYLYRARLSIEPAFGAELAMEMPIVARMRIPPLEWNMASRF